LKGPLIISPNHQSYLDVFVVVGLLPYRLFRQLFFVGASEYFEGPLLRRIARLLNVVPIDPDASLVSAMQASAAGLRRGKVLVLFPEGERSIDGTVKSFKKGGAILSHHLGVPVLPVALDGLFAIWARERPVNWRILRPWRRARVAVRFGAPILPRAEAAAAITGIGGTATVAPAAIYSGITAQIRAAVASMYDEIAGEG
jgi:long-chain acyl-CoA synthetase